MVIMMNWFGERFGYTKLQETPVTYKKLKNTTMTLTWLISMKSFPGTIKLPVQKFYLLKPLEVPKT